MKKIIVIPTYNEKANIEPLLWQIKALNIPDLEVLVVDDNSPDGTGQLVEAMGRNETWVSCLHRPRKEGLGKAYVAGFSEALVRGADIVFEMDADFSHDPRYIPEILAALENSDLVLGSRYCEGGGIQNWNLLRRAVSFFGNWYARTVLGVRVRDLTGGFKCYRRKVLEAIRLDELDSVGYNFQIETTYKALRLGFRVIEIPITFVERRSGSSKFDLGIILESFIKVLRLRVRQR